MINQSPSERKTEFVTFNDFVNGETQVIIETCFNPLFNIQSLNPNAALFYSKKCLLSPTISQTSTLNPYAKSFIPYFIKSKLNCIIGSIFRSFITIFISLLITLDIIKVDKGDEPPPKEILKQMKHKNPDIILVAHLNINSIRNKLESLAEITGKNIDLFFISETKIDASFPYRPVFY